MNEPFFSIVAARDQPGLFVNVCPMSLPKARVEIKDLMLGPNQLIQDRLAILISCRDANQLEPSSRVAL